MRRIVTGFSAIALAACSAADATNDSQDSANHNVTYNFGEAPAQANTEQVDVAGVRIGMTKAEAVKALQAKGYQVEQSGGFDPKDSVLALSFANGLVTGVKGPERVRVTTAELPEGGIVRRVEYRRQVADLTIEQQRQLVDERYPQFPKADQQWGVDSRDVDAMLNDKPTANPVRRYPVLTFHPSSASGLMIILEGRQALVDQIAARYRKYQAEQHPTSKPTF